MKTIYLVGPMDGLPDYNRAAFNAAAARLREEGYRVYDPAENDPSLTREQHLRLDIEHILKSDAIALLPGWQNSSGARLEFEIAQAIGLVFFGKFADDTWGIIDPEEVWEFSGMIKELSLGLFLTNDTDALFEPQRAK
jgi:hypothetical protein